MSVVAADATLTPEISVVIPTLNEARAIGTLLGRLERESPRPEVIVVDCGSADGTTERVREFPWVTLLCVGRGRAKQMNAGAERSRGETLLFLHADTEVPDGALRRVREEVANGADYGCFELQIDSDDPRLRVASEMISLRSRVIPSATGDQGQFFRREFFFSLGKYPEIPLLEDMELIRLASLRGRYSCIDLRLGTSARRWTTHGITRTMTRMLVLRALYHLGVAPNALARFYNTHPRSH